LKRRRGFTFVEAAIGVALASIVAIVVLSVMIFGQKRSRTSIERADFQRMGLTTVAHIMHNMLGAREILFPVAVEGPACCFQAYDCRFHAYVFLKEKNVLIHQVMDPSSGDMGKEKVLAENVREATFSVGVDPRLVRIRMVFSKLKEKGLAKDEYPLETSIALRN